MDLGLDLKREVNFDGVWISNDKGDRLFFTRFNPRYLSLPNIIKDFRESVKNK
jgi:hypothetical protein